MADTKELIEALHYIKSFRGQRFIVKIGGEILSDERILETIALDLVLLNSVDIHIVIIHGAGVQISANMKRFGIEPKFIRGERVTDEEVLDLVMGCLHHVNNKIVGKINKGSTIAVGLTCGLFKAKRKKQKELGCVGEITGINSEIIFDLIGKGYLPVTFPIGMDEEGNPLNINADVAAGELAKTLGVTKMIILTHVQGVLDRNGKLIRLAIGFWTALASSAVSSPPELAVDALGIETPSTSIQAKHTKNVPEPNAFNAESATTKSLFAL